jgi:hypothetical protein
MAMSSEARLLKLINDIAPDDWGATIEQRILAEAERRGVTADVLLRAGSSRQDRLKSRAAVMLIRTITETHRADMTFEAVLRVLNSILFREYGKRVQVVPEEPEQPLEPPVP